MTSLKKTTNKILLLIFFIFFMREDVVFADYWPSLYEPRDFITVSENNFNEKNIDIEKMTPEMVQKKLLQTFHFFSDFISETNSEKPRNWINPLTNPKEALEIGYPEYFKRPNNEINFPVYPLKSVAYFQGDNLTNSAINVCQTYWFQNLDQETYNCFSNLQYNMLRGIYPSSPLIKMQVNILQGFFMLQLLINNDREVKNISFNSIPPTLFRFKQGEILKITKAIFNYVASHYKQTLFISKDPTKNNVLSNYSQFFNSPYYLVKTEKKQFYTDLSPDFISPVVKNPNYSVVSLDKESVPVLSWIQTVMPIVYANVMGLSIKKEEWQKGYQVGEKFEKYLNSISFPAQLHQSSIYKPSLTNVSQAIYLKPMNNNDLLTMTDLYKALVLQKLQQPDVALKYISKGILRNGDPDLISLLFKISGDAYYDLNMFHLSRRSYSWSEMYSSGFVDKVPSPLFFGAESAFWLGKYDIAKSGFKRFLLSTGDTTFAPIANLRLGTIEQLQGNKQSAKSIYENIVRNLNTNYVAQEASVNLFCMNMNQLTPKVRRMDYENVVKKIKNARPDVQRQAKACLLNSDLIDATLASVSDTKRNVVEKAEMQKNIIQKYNKEFPENEFIVLFADRIKQLELPQAALLSSQNKCFDLINFYEKNKSKLNELSKNNNKYVKGLKWSPVERTKLLRCSAFLSNFKLWKEARQFDIGKDGEDIHNKFYRLSTTPSSQAALDMYYSLKNSSKQWETKLEKVENSNTEITNRHDFWELLSLQKFLNYEFSTDKETKNLLSNAIVKDIMKEPKLIFELPIFCSWFLSGFDNLSSSNFDTVTQIYPAQTWLSILTTSQNQNKCQTVVAQNLLAQSLKNPSDIRDKVILLPYLQNQGIEKTSDIWLSYVRRLESQRGAQDKEVVDIYTNLSKNSKDLLIKSSALAWIKKNFPNSADNILW